MLFSTMPMLLGELLQEGQVRGIEIVQRSELDHGLDLALEHHRQHQEATRHGARTGRADRHRVGRDIGDMDAPLLDARIWPIRPSPSCRRVGIAVARVVGVAGQQRQIRVPSPSDIHLIDQPLLGVDQRRQLARAAPARPWSDRAGPAACW